MNENTNSKSRSGFSIVELMIAMAIVLIVLGLVTTLFSRSLNTRQRESSRTDAQTAAQAALNVLTREIANSGYGLIGNGIVTTDSGAQQLHILSNVQNTDDDINEPGEDITYFFEPTSQSILRYDANAGGPGVAETSIIINRISSVNFDYFDYQGSNPVPSAASATPTLNTGRVRVTITVSLENVLNQVNPSSVVLTSDVTLRNADYMLRNY